MEVLKLADNQHKQLLSYRFRCCTCARSLGDNKGFID